jgi:threonine dehydrogenase-like Zn-dependent dehydrogenase
VESVNDQELRLLVRAAVARHLGIDVPAPPANDAGQMLYTGLVNVTDACVIEPAVPCDHCGYCKSHGY